MKADWDPCSHRLMALGEELVDVDRVEQPRPPDMTTGQGAAGGEVADVPLPGVEVLCDGRCGHVLDDEGSGQLLVAALPHSFRLYKLRTMSLVHTIPLPTLSIK